MITQGPPKFEVNREETYRRLLHFSVRQIISQEDPFGTHLSVKAGARMASDLSKHLGIEILSHEQVIKPELLNEWRRINNDTYNYLKHAERDPHRSLPVFDLPLLNRLQTLLNAVNFKSLFGKQTAHINLYTAYFSATEPDAQKFINFPEEFWLGLKLFPDMKSRESWKTVFLDIPEVQSEYLKDTDDTLFSQQ